MQNSGKTTHVKLWALLAIFIVPFIISLFLYVYHANFNFKTTNHGELLTPPLPASEWVANDGKKIWQIVFVPVDCTTAQSENIMFSLHQLRLILGKDLDRVGLTLATKKMCLLPDVHDFRKVRMSDELYVQLQTLKPEQPVENSIYLVDPEGNLFMYYSSTTNPMNVLKDLKHLLEVSQIG
jgi:hypothetical protein